MTPNSKNTRICSPLEAQLDAEFPHVGPRPRVEPLHALSCDLCELALRVLPHPLADSADREPALFAPQRQRTKSTTHHSGGAPCATTTTLTTTSDRSTDRASVARMTSLATSVGGGREAVCHSSIVQ